MATFSNWTGFNKQLDVISRRTARSILNYIRTLQARLAQFKIDESITDLNAHIADDNNPHRLHFPDFTNQYITYVYSLYAQKTQSPILLEEWMTLMSENPLLLIEVSRRFQLNALSYEDYVGSMPANLLDPTDLTMSYPTVPPLYFLSYSLKDFMLDMAQQSTGSYQRTIDEISHNSFTILFSLKVDPTDQTPDSVITLGNADGGKITFFVNENEQSCFFSMASPGYFVSNVPPVDSPSTKGIISYYPTQVTVSEWKIALSVQGNDCNFYYINNNQLQSIYLGTTTQKPVSVFNQLTSHIPVYDQSVKRTGLKSLIVYPGALSADDIDAVFMVI